VRSKQGNRPSPAFSPAEIDSALAMSTAKIRTGVVFEMEHNPWGRFRALPRLPAIHAQPRGRILKAGFDRAPRVTPMVRIPVNGGGEKEKAQMAGENRRLDVGCYGNRMAAHLDRGRGLQRGSRPCRYPRMNSV